MKMDALISKGYKYEGSGSLLLAVIIFVLVTSHTQRTLCKLAPLTTGTTTTTKKGI